MICCIGYLIFFGNVFSDNDNSTVQYTNDTNLTVNESNEKEIAENGAEISSDNKQFNNTSQISNYKTISSKSDIIKESNKILNNNRKFFGKNAVVNNAKYGGNGMWYVDFIDSKTGKKVGTTYIDDKTGKMVDAM